MLPLRHNFLSPEKISYLQRMVKFQFIKTVLEISLIFLCVAGIMLLGGQWILQGYFNDLTSQIISISNQYSGTNAEIKKINQILNKNEKIQKEYTIWTNKIIELSNAVPETITLASLSFDQSKKTVNFSGLAPTREDLLLFQENIQKLSWIKSLDIPLSQLTNKEKINFSLTAFLK